MLRSVLIGLLIVALAGLLGLFAGDRINAHNSGQPPARTMLVTGGVHGASALLQQNAPKTERNRDAKRA